MVAVSRRTLTNNKISISSIFIKNLSARRVVRRKTAADRFPPGFFVTFLLLILLTIPAVSVRIRRTRYALLIIGRAGETRASPMNIIVIIPRKLAVYVNISGR